MKGWSGTRVAGKGSPAYLLVGLFVGTGLVVSGVLAGCAPLPAPPPPPDTVALPAPPPDTVVVIETRFEPVGTERVDSLEEVLWATEAARVEAVREERTAARRAAAAEARASEAEARARQIEERLAEVQDDTLPVRRPPNAVDTVIARLGTAPVRFRAPAQLSLHEPGQVTLTILPADTGGPTPPGVVERTRDDVRVSLRMAASLEGGGRFDIQLDDGIQEEQLRSNVEPTYWKWTVVPQEVGDSLPLTANLYAIVEVGDTEGSRRVGTFAETINVRVTLGERVSSFIGEHWKWLWAVILVPFAEWIRRRWFGGDGEEPAAE